MSIPLQIGQIVELTSERIAYGGEAVARYEGFAVFIPFAAPGERLRVRIIELRKKYARAVIEEILGPSPERRIPQCTHFGVCGGCQFQHLDYQLQLEAKAGFIHDALSRIGGLDYPHPIKVLSSPDYGYRLRAQIKVQPIRSPDSNSSLRIGFTKAGSHTVCDVEFCPVLAPELNTGLLALRREILAKPEQREREFELASDGSSVLVDPPLAANQPQLLKRSVGGIEYAFEPGTFFQPNAMLLEALVTETIGDSSGDFAIDLYAGVGLFALQLAKRYTRVEAVESNRRAWELAVSNAASNRITNVRFWNQRTEAWLSELASTAIRVGSAPPDLVILDPPRQGASEALKWLLELGSRQIVYVSCDPTTLARDLKRLTAGGYDLTEISAMDLFPQTFHVETIARLLHR